MNTSPIKRALISVSDKTGVVDFAKNLIELGVEIISTGGTSQLLREAQLPHKQVEEVTGLCEMLDGRVKTLHPKIHGGILGRRDQHAQEAKQHDIHWIDLVVVNFYPFEEVQKQAIKNWDDAIEYIDVGGPTMVRAAAKNFSWVGVVIDPNDYASVISELRTHQGLLFDTRKKLAEKAFGTTSAYDALIHHYFLSSENTENDCQSQHQSLSLNKVMTLRYGENPHQKACAYQVSDKKSRVLSAKQHQGKPLSFNNLLDMDAALRCISEFKEPACVIVKHANPCGVAVGSDITDAYKQAYSADSLSAFGGVVALNQSCSKEIASEIVSIFMEGVIAPSYSPEALALFASKPNLRILEASSDVSSEWEMKFIDNGVLVQERDNQIIQESDLKIVTDLIPNSTDMANMLFAWRVLKHAKSNAILIAKNNKTIGIGAGQVSRVDAVDIAVRKSGEQLAGCILASDAFFPFRDSIDRLANKGIRAIIQPGGSVRDDEVIRACNEHGIAMALTGIRCFRH
jgi:phosphoribosylaminoimidazolecarboxamide formyltransferase/IMP cyclohydrolase